MFKIGEFYLGYFNLFHLYILGLCCLLGVVVLNIHTILPKMSVDRFAKIMSIFLIIFKIFDSSIRYFFEYSKLLEVLPFNLCNIALIFCSYYLFTKKEWAFNIFYYFSFGAIIALIVPDIKVYHLNIYVYIYSFIHALEIIFVLYINKYLKPKLTFRYFKITSITLTLIMIFNYIFNTIFNTNYMFLNKYALPELSVINNIYIYTLGIVVLYYLGLYLIYILSVRFSDLFEEVNDILNYEEGI